MKMVTQLSLTAMTALLALASGCQTGPVHKQGFDFSHYHTFAIRPLPTTGTTLDPTIVARLGPTARQAVQETLAGKGFKEAPQSEADFQVELLFDRNPHSRRQEQQSSLGALEAPVDGPHHIPGDRPKSCC